MRKYIFYGIWAGMVLMLLILSFQYKDRTKAMVAQVENQNTAISYRKSVRIRKIHVVPGQEVEAGAVLLEVEQPDLVADLEKKVSQQTQIEVRISSAIDTYFLSLATLTTETRRKLAQLEGEQNLLHAQMSMDNRKATDLRVISNIELAIPVDSLKLIQLAYIEKEINDISKFNSLKRSQLETKFKQDTFLLRAEKKIVESEIEILKQEASRLVRYAENAGTIGNLFVQLNELVPPYKTIISIYSLKPSIIRAFVSERNVSDLKVGASVRVESTNRLYEIQGQIIEIGSRITSYPDKINPTFGIKSYGQEVFVKIPEDNSFLNGEKVYVYLLGDVEN